MGDNEQITGPVQSVVVKWLVTQGASTVLLFAIVCFLGYGAPMLLDKHDQEMKYAREKHATELKDTRDDFRASLKEQREDFVEAIEKCEARHASRMGSQN